jgi:hypothetical protein
VFHSGTLTGAHDGRAALITVALIEVARQTLLARDLG